MDLEELTWEQDYNTNYPYVVGIYGNYNNEETCYEELRYKTFEDALKGYEKFTNKKYIKEHTITKLSKYNAEFDGHEEMLESEVKEN